MRNPEGVLDWIGGQRRSLKAMGRLLTNREMYICFKDCSIAKSQKLTGVIERHCLSLEFSGGSYGDGFQEKFANYISTIDEHFYSKSIKKQYGQADVYDGTQVILNNYRIPGSRAKGKDNAREGKGAH